jgi:hypothetical protein
MSVASVRIFHNDRNQAAASAHYLRTLGWQGPIALTELDAGHLVDAWADTLEPDNEVAS